MTIAEKIDKPSDVIAAFINSIRRYKKEKNYVVRLGAPGVCAQQGSLMHVTEAATTLMETTGLSFDSLNNRMNLVHSQFTDASRFMDCAQHLANGLPWYLFEYLGRQQEFVRPDRWWILLDTNWETHIKYVEDYWLKLHELGL